MSSKKLPSLKTCTLEIMLDQYSGDEEATWETLKVFYEQFENDLPKLVSKDPLEVRHTAHKMKTGVHLLGLDRLKEMQQEAAAEVCAKRMEHAQDLHDGLQEVLDELKPHLY